LRRFGKTRCKQRVLMGAIRQQTLARSVAFAGVGLHSGLESRIVLRPAGTGCGVVFQRCDDLDCDDLDCDGLNGVSHDRHIVAAPGNVAYTQLATTVSNNQGVSVATIEHLMAALALCRIDNVSIDVFGREIPILDGSAAPFVEAIRAAGALVQDAPRRVFVIRERLCVEDGDRSISVEPLDHLRLDVAIDFEDCVIGRQSLSVRLDDVRDQERLAQSRTFCRLHEVEKMRTAGLIRGGSLENSIVIDGDRMLNGEALRDPEEFALHKALDLIGDLSLLGGQVIGHIRANKPGHDLNNRFARALAAQFAPGKRPAAEAGAVLAASA